MNMLEVQLEHFTKTPLLTNTQPDFSRVGNSELLDRTVRSNNWIRSDTIFIENEQIETLSNRPPWIAALLEQGLPGKPPDAAAAQEGISPAENMIAHVMDIGANYWSLWNFHQISAKNLATYYQAYPQVVRSHQSANWLQREALFHLACTKTAATSGWSSGSPMTASLAFRAFYGSRSKARTARC
jgi:hypothetical protein